LEALTGKPQDGTLSGANAFAPGIDAFLKEHLFADIFGRGVLTYQQRELVTISILASLPSLEAQLQAHMGMGMHVGLTEVQLKNAFDLIRSNISQQQADTALSVLARVTADK
jgi:alkylhydroperoxidase/carboxymuconolactone decarboxylase family protein YurZ